MGVYDNPSADKFGPPPGQERFEAPTSRRAPQWFGLILLAAFYVGKYELEHVRASGWVIPAMLAGIFIGEFLVKRRVRSERQTTNPLIPTPSVPR